MLEVSAFPLWKLVLGNQWLSPHFHCNPQSSQRGPNLGVTILRFRRKAAFSGSSDGLTPCSQHLIHAHEVWQSKQHRQFAVIFLQTTVAGFHKAELELDDSERMLDFGAEAGLQILGADFDLIDTRVLFQGLQLPGLFCDVPVCTHIFQLVPLFGASVTCNGQLNLETCLGTF